MLHNRIPSQTQDDICIRGKIDDFFDRFHLGTALHRNGIRKRNGHSPRALLQAIFTLPFLGQNFFRGIVLNRSLPFGKDAAYELLKGTRYNWRRLLLTIGRRIFVFFNRLTKEDRESVLIVDDSLYDRSRSKAVEMLCRVHDHNTGRYVKGFRMLTVCWSDGVSCLPLDFALLSSRTAKKQLRPNEKTMDKRCCASRRRREATKKATTNLPDMLRRILSVGVKAKYVLMDSWFTHPATVTKLHKHLPVIGMVKKTEKIHYEYQGQHIDIKAIYRRLRKKPGRAKILASTIVTLKNGPAAKLVFVRDRIKKDWLALLTTDTELADADVVRIYGKRWDIEVFFKMAKQHLNLSKEIQCRDYDALIAHTSIVFLRYMFLSFECRLSSDKRTFGDLFYACCEEMRDLTYMESLMRILTLAIDNLRKLGTFCEKTCQAIFYAVVRNAVKYMDLCRHRSIVFLANPES
jgi:hypothetical protein